MTRILSFAAVALLGLSLTGVAVSRASMTYVSEPTVPATHIVTAGFGDRGGMANIFAPQVMEIFTGDTVTWKVGGNVEPHTVTFGPQAMLDKIARGVISPVAQKSGSPLIAFNSKVAFPTMSTTYAGEGYANSGLLARTGKSWSLTFTKPGTYPYYCLIHYIPGQPEKSMGGEVIVNARPVPSHHYTVSMGSGKDSIMNADDSFNPKELTIHTGDSVTWIGAFHTVTFGLEATMQALEKHFIVPMPQQSGGLLLTINAKIALPAGGSSFNGTGWVNSGFLQPSANGGPSRYTLTFTKPGAYKYDCMVHAGMDGSITVLAPGM